MLKGAIGDSSKVLAGGKASNLSLGDTKPLSKGGQPVRHSHVDRYSDGVKQMQLEMQAAGIDPGPIDGLKGPLTRAAMRKYEEQFGASAAKEFGVNPDWAEIADARPNFLGRLPTPTELGSTNPEDRAQYDGKFATVQGKQMTPGTAAAFQRMYDAAKRDGVNLFINSAYRDPAYQAKLFNQAIAKYGSVAAARKWVAPPGRSEHQTGRALDLNMGQSGAHRWLQQNAGQFGFRQSYSWEPWHWYYKG